MLAWTILYRFENVPGICLDLESSSSDPWLLPSLVNFATRNSVEVLQLIDEVIVALNGTPSFKQRDR